MVEEENFKSKTDIWIIRNFLDFKRKDKIIVLIYMLSTYKTTEMRANSFNTGIASEYLILSKLYRLDLEAYISQGNKKSVDIRVIRKNNTPVSIDVKSVRAYSSLVVNNVKPKDNHFLVFVIYNNKFEDLKIEPEIFIIPSIELFNADLKLTETYGNEKRVLKGKLKDYKNKWEYISGDYGKDACLRE